MRDALRPSRGPRVLCPRQPFALNTHPYLHTWAARSPGTPSSISAVVVNHNGGERVIRTIQALLDQPKPLDQIIVTDNASDDGSPERVAERFPEVSLIRLSSNLGLPAARNVGLRQADSEYVLLIDDDVRVARDCIERLVVATREHNAAVACPRVRLHPDRGVVQCDGADVHFTGTMVLRHANGRVDRLPSEPVAVGGCIGACMLVDRRLVLEAGGFDELYFFYFEDLEFGLRLRALGRRLVCEPRAVVFHDRDEGTPGLSFRGRGRYPPRRAYLTTRHRLLTILIHYRLRSLIVLAPALLLYDLASLALMLVRGWGLLWFRAHSWPLLHAGDVVRRRRWIQKRRVTGDRELLVGGPLPIAEGFIRSRASRILVTTLGAALNLYWRMARCLIA